MSAPTMRAACSARPSAAYCSRHSGSAAPLRSASRATSSRSPLRCGSIIATAYGPPGSRASSSACSKGSCWSGDRRLIGTLVVTVIYNTFGWPFTSMIPVIGQDNLGLGAAGIGVLASMDGVGAFCGAVAIAIFAKPGIFARLYVGGVFAYLLMLPVFALAPNPLLAGTVLLVTGRANAGFSIM